MRHEPFRDLQDVLRFAIAREEEAAAFYRGMIPLAETPGLRELLLDLEGQEREHKRLLEDILSRGTAPMAERTYIADLAVTDFIEAEPAGGDMGLQDLLVLAARKEKRAADLYGALAAGETREDFRRTFEFLKAQELGHKLRLETEYERLILAEN